MSELAALGLRAREVVEHRAVLKELGDDARRRHAGGDPLGRRIAYAHAPDAHDVEMVELLEHARLLQHVLDRVGRNELERHLPKVPVAEVDGRKEARAELPVERDLLGPQQVGAGAHPAPRPVPHLRVPRITFFGHRPPHRIRRIWRPARLVAVVRKAGWRRLPCDQPTMFAAEPVAQQQVDEAHRRHAGGGRHGQPQRR